MKSSLALYSYIYRPLKDHPEKDMKFIYYSLELSAEALLAKLLSLWIYETYKIVISYSSMMSWRNPLSNEDYSYICAGKAWLESISTKLIIIDTNLTSKIFYHKTLSFLEEWGRFEESPDGRRKLYIKNNPEQTVNVVLDHIGLCVSSDGRTKKQEIDLISQYAVSLRERCGVSFYVLQQENRNSSSAEKIKMEMTDCSADGLKDSGNTLNDCELCIGVYYPLKYKVKTKAEYPIIRDDDGSGFIGLRDRIRFLQIIKNRNGESDRSIPVAFYGEVGYFQELPKASEMPDFKPYMSLHTLPKPGEEINTPKDLGAIKTNIKYSF